MKQAPLTIAFLNLLVFPGLGTYFAQNKRGAYIQLSLSCGGLLLLAAGVSLTARWVLRGGIPLASLERLTPFPTQDITLRTLEWGALSTTQLIGLPYGGLAFISAGSLLLSTSLLLAILSSFPLPNPRAHL